MRLPRRAHCPIASDHDAPHRDLPTGSSRVRDTHRAPTTPVPRPGWRNHEYRINALRRRSVGDLRRRPGRWPRAGSTTYRAHHSRSRGLPDAAVVEQHPALDRCHRSVLSRPPVSTIPAQLARQDTGSGMFTLAGAAVALALIASGREPARTTKLALWTALAAFLIDIYTY